MITITLLLTAPRHLADGCRGQDVRSRLALVASPDKLKYFHALHLAYLPVVAGAGRGEDVVTLIAGFRCNRRQDIQLKISRLPGIGANCN